MNLKIFLFKKTMKNVKFWSISTIIEYIINIILIFIISFLFYIKFKQIKYFFIFCDIAETQINSELSPLSLNISSDLAFWGSWAILGVSCALMFYYVFCAGNNNNSDIIKTVQQSKLDAGGILENTQSLETVKTSVSSDLASSTASNSFISPYKSTLGVDDAVSSFSQLVLLPGDTFSSLKSISHVEMPTLLSTSTIILVSKIMEEPFILAKHLRCPFLGMFSQRVLVHSRDESYVFIDVKTLKEWDIDIFYHFFCKIENFLCYDKVNENLDVGRILGSKESVILWLASQEAEDPLVSFLIKQAKRYFGVLQSDAAVLLFNSLPNHEAYEVYRIFISGF